MALSSPAFAVTSHFEGIRVAVVEADDHRCRELTELLSVHHAAGFSSVESLEDRLASGQAVVVVLGPSYADPIGLMAVERLLRLHPDVASILVVDVLTTEALQRALRVGVRDVLAAPVDPEQLLVAVSRVAGTLVPVPIASPVEPDQTGLVDGGGRGRVITVFSTKGGAGKSVVASNLAVTLARRVDEPVVLVDADLQFGDVAVMLKLAPQHTIVDAVTAIDRLDASLLHSLLVRHETSGLFVLPAPLEPAFADQISSAEMARIINLLRTFAAYVIVDTPAYFNDVVLGLIETSDDVVLVAGMDIPNIKNVKIGLQTLRLLNVPLSKLKLVLNRANSKVKLDVSEVERTLGIKADALVPSDIVVPQAVNKGVAVVLEAPRSGVARSIEALADAFTPATTGRKKR